MTSLHPIQRKYHSIALQRSTATLRFCEDKETGRIELRSKHGNPSILLKIGIRVEHHCDVIERWR